MENKQYDLDTTKISAKTVQEYIALRNFRGISNYTGIYRSRIPADCSHISFDLEGALEGDVFESQDGNVQICYYDNYFRIVSDSPGTFAPDYAHFINISRKRREGAENFGRQKIKTEE